jgi:hypothetical protein
MAMSKCVVWVATLPLPATIDGTHTLVEVSPIYFICHPCHLFMERNIPYQLKILSQTDGNPGIKDLPVHGVLGKSFSAPPLPPSTWC